ncbi:EexN family lipoprotein [Erwinia tracheiphila]|nr:EexN family lipoprotein [Erwinia tracheiphila]UIA89718.1 EexN family lipoprotein [Erwinia tracheiphila]UIA98019.1 EexN family lipoprotein [Erwinia tracheiphila]
MSGCGDKEYDASYYQANHEKAEETLKKCEAGEISGRSCDNARVGFDNYKAEKLEQHLLGKSL